MIYNSNTIKCAFKRGKLNLKKIRDTQKVFLRPG